MNGLCHLSEPTMRSPQMITMNGLGREEICGACWEAFHLAHSPPWRTSKKGSRRHFPAFRAALPVAETGLCFGVS